MNKSVLLVMAKNHHPLQSLRLVFAEGVTGFSLLAFLLLAERQGRARFEPANLEALVIHETNDWDSNKTRTLTVSFPVGLLWGDAEFIRLAEAGLVSASVVGASNAPVAKVGSSRSKLASQAFSEVSGWVLPPNLNDEISGYGYSASVEKLEEEGMALVVVTLMDDSGHRVVQYRLSAWSGNIFRNDQWILFCASEGSLRGIAQRIKEDFEAHLEAVTAA